MMIIIIIIAMIKTTLIITILTANILMIPKMTISMPIVTTIVLMCLRIMATTMITRRNDIQGNQNWFMCLDK